MQRPHTKISEKPKKFCNECKREVYSTVHTINSYWVDWYTREGIITCIDCY